jgi:hypothetical protein
MKKLPILLTLFVFLFAGCAGQSINKQQAELLGIKMAAFNLGFYVGKSKTDTDDKAIRDGYELAKTGQFSPQSMNDAMLLLKGQNPQVAANCMFALEAMGAMMTADKSIIDLSKIPPEAWTAAEQSYTMGYTAGLAEKK